MDRLKNHIKESKVDIGKTIIEVDTNKNGVINRNEFLKINKKIKSPLTVLEQKGLFGHLTESTGSKITVPDLTNILKSTSKRSPAPKPPSPGPKPRSPDTKPRSPDAKPRSPDTKPRSPDAKPHSPDTKPRSPQKPKVDTKTKEKLSSLEASIREKNALIKSLEAELNQLKTQIPSRSSKQDLSALKSENNRLLEESKRAIHEKKSLEKILKENFSTPESGDFILLQKKIELLEQSLYERDSQIKKEKYNSTTYQKYKREIEGLTKQIEEERAYYLGIIQKKNQEIAVFRQELDMLLQEVDHVKEDNMEKERIFMGNKSEMFPR